MGSDVLLTRFCQVWWDDSGVGGGDKGKRESASSSSSLDSAMIKPKYHFDRRFCLSLSIRPTQIAVSALPSFLPSKIRSGTVVVSLPFPNQTGGGGDFENFDPPQIRPSDE